MHYCFILKKKKYNYSVMPYVVMLRGCGLEQPNPVAIESKEDADDSRPKPGSGTNAPNWEMK